MALQVYAKATKVWSSPAVAKIERKNISPYFFPNLVEGGWGRIAGQWSSINLLEINPFSLQNICLSIFLSNKIISISYRIQILYQIKSR